MTYHIPLCLNCGNHEVQAPYTFGDGEGFCSQKCEKDANEGFEDEADYYASWRDEQVQEAVAPSGDQMYEDRYEDHMAQYDDDPSPYGGTYSEE